MKRLFLMICAVSLFACGGGSGSGSGGGGSADNYWRSGQAMPAVLAFTADSYNPVIRDSNKEPYMLGGTEDIKVLANGFELSALAKVDNANLVVTVLVPPSDLAPLADLFDVECSVPDVNVAFISFETETEGLDITKVGVDGNGNYIGYIYYYADGDANINCRYEDDEGEINDIKINIKSGWNELRVAEVDITSIRAVEEYWVLDDIEDEL